MLYFVLFIRMVSSLFGGYLVSVLLHELLYGFAQRKAFDVMAFFSCPVSFECAPEMQNYQLSVCVSAIVIALVMGVGRPAWLALKPAKTDKDEKSSTLN